MMKNRFQGCLLGALIGDCLGAPFEMSYFGTDGIKKEKILQKLQMKFDKNYHIFKYTDDTAMTLSVASSLLESNGFEAQHMATKFTESFFNEPRRGYGGGVVSIFHKWNNGMITDSNVNTPSKEQFDFSGSYGNGAAMRVSPVALFSNSVKQCIKIARNSALLTHSNKHGTNGAILQALAVYKALNWEPRTFNAEEFITFLRNEMAKIEKVDEQRCKIERIEDIQEYTRSDAFSYCRQLDLIKSLVKSQEKVELSTVIQNIGNDISAMTAVPAAIISFLLNVEKGFEEVLYYSISLGGDTDTIASMACSIAGALYGDERIPNHWKSKSENSLVLVKLASNLYESRCFDKK